MSRSTQYFLTTAVVVAFVLIAFFVYGVAAGPSPDEATAGATPSPAPAVSAPAAPAASAQARAVPGDFSPADIYRRSAAGVVLVRAGFGDAEDPHGGLGESLGSGFVVDGQGTILTNAHVVSQDGLDATRVSVAFREGEDGGGGQVEAEILGVDQTTDIAVLRVDPSGLDLVALPLGDSSRVVIGQWVVAIGNPLGFDFSLTAGIVSGIGRDLQAPNGAIIPNGIQTDAAINQGNSGGPLLDQDGNVIGINEQIATTSGSFSGLGFAIPINLARSVMQQIAETGEVRHAYLGVQGQTITPALADVLGLPAEEGVLVVSVQDGTAAEQAGIRGGTETRTIQGMSITVGGDVITRLDGAPLASMQELASEIAQRRPGDEVTLTLLRDGSSRDLTLPLGERPGD
jgi:S1-C subfamily serine protease